MKLNLSIGLVLILLNVLSSQLALADCGPGLAPITYHLVQDASGKVEAVLLGKEKKSVHMGGEWFVGNESTLSCVDVSVAGLLDTWPCMWRAVPLKNGGITFEIIPDATPATPCADNQIKKSESDTIPRYPAKEKPQTEEKRKAHMLDVLKGDTGIPPQ